MAVFLLMCIVNGSASGQHLLRTSECLEDLLTIFKFQDIHCNHGASLAECESLRACHDKVGNIHSSSLLGSSLLCAAVTVLGVAVNNEV